MNWNTLTAPPRSDRAARLVVCALIGFLFLTGAPVGGAFGWVDAPRHALNGAFVMDFIAAAPFDDPTAYAYDYYLQYPALTILFYPPFFYFLSAPFYALLGFSHETAVFMMFVFYCALGTGAYALLRQWFRASLALGVTAILVCTPEIAYWGRQVMLEIPAFAFLVWSAYFLVRHVRTKRISLLYLSIALLVLSAHTKLTVAFIVLPFTIELVRARGAALVRDKHSYVILGLAILGVLPLVYLTLEFGRVNVESVAGVVDADVARASLAGWTYYAVELHRQLGWPALAAALAGLLAFLARRSGKLDAIREHVLPISWFVVGYVFFSAIDLKEERHDVYLFLPALMLVGPAVDVLQRRSRWLGNACLGALAVATLVITMVTRPIDSVEGYRDAVDYVSEHAPRDGNVLFSGFRDGQFICLMRAYSERKDLSIIRADKLLLRIAVRRATGVEQEDYTEAEIAELISSLGVRYVVYQPDFWTDLEQMRRLQNVLTGDQFEEVGRFPLSANFDAADKELVVCRNLGDVAPGPVKISYDLPIIGRSISNDDPK